MDCLWVGWPGKRRRQPSPTAVRVLQARRGRAPRRRRPGRIVANRARPCPAMGRNPGKGRARAAFRLAEPSRFPAFRLPEPSRFPAETRAHRTGGGPDQARFPSRRTGGLRPVAARALRAAYCRRKRPPPPSRTPPLPPGAPPGPVRRGMPAGPAPGPFSRGPDSRGPRGRRMGLCPVLRPATRSDDSASRTRQGRANGCPPG